MMRLCSLPNCCPYQINTIHNSRKFVIIYDFYNITFFSIYNFTLIDKIVNIKQRKSFRCL